MAEEKRPAGPITCLFTDIEVSTTLSEGVPPLEWQRIAGEHDRRVRECIRRFPTEPEHDEGDSFFAVFQNARDALLCAIAIQNEFRLDAEQALFVEKGSERLPIKVRIGVYTAEEEVYRTDQGGFRSREVNLAHRLMNCGYGGQILVSESAHRMAATYIEPMEWVEWKNRYIRDFSGPVTLHEMLWDGGKSRGMKAPLWAPDWLLREVNKFIGRDEYLQQIVQWLKGDRPLLLLHGQGGIGKTRLASQAVRHPDVGSHFEGRIYGVALDLEFGIDSAKATPRRLALAIAQAVGASESDLNPLVDEALEQDANAIVQHLAAILEKCCGGPEFLLVLDNFESVHTPPVLTLLTQLLRRVHAMRCLVTCRFHFNIGAISQAVSIEGLPIPSSAGEKLETFDGFLLFRERALQNAPALDLSDKPSLVRILQATEGNALGIELVAARTDTPLLTLARMADDLEASRLNIQGPDPDAFVHRVDVDRHISLEACFDWSLRLLPLEEQALYPHLSVFPADFTAAAAQSIADIPEGHLRRWILWNLLQQNEARTRVSLSPALREFAERKLSVEERGSLSMRFASYYADLAAANDDMNKLAQRLALGTELHNLLQAAQGLSLHSSATPEDARRLNSLSIALWKAPLGVRFANIERAIICFEAALQVYTQHDFSYEWASIQNNLGNAYSDLPTGNQGANLQRAIICYEAALKITTELNFPQEWASTQNNLGNAYSKLSTGDRVTNLQKAIGCFEAALRVRAKQSFPHDWAMTQNNLGLTYSSLPDGNLITNLQKAIGCFEAALRVYTPQNFPLDWAVIQNNLGTIYSKLPVGDRGANLQQTIACYEAALKIYTQQSFPHDWAMIQNNLGSAYYDLPIGDQGANLQRAIVCYEAALQVYTEHDFPHDWAMTQNNLGNAYSKLSTGDRAANLQKAIGCFEAALRVYTPQNFPLDWAAIQNNLGTIYSKLPVGDQRAKLQKAIGYFEAALKITPQQDFPQDWAETTANIGLALEKLGKRPEARERLEQARDVFVRCGHTHHAQRVKAILRGMDGAST